MSKQLELLKLEAAANLHQFGSMYSGNGLVIGLDETGQNLVQIYTIIIRNEGYLFKRNSFLKQDTGGRVYTAVIDQAMPSIAAYNAMVEVDHELRFAVVGNGTHADIVADDYAQDYGFFASLRRSSISFFDDLTPRITACSYWGEDGHVRAKIAMHRKSQFSNACERLFYEKNDCLEPGFGYALTTFCGQSSDPSLPFQGEPYLVSLHGDVCHVAETYWGTLDPVHRIAIAVKFIPKNKKEHSRCCINNRFYLL